MYVWKSARWLKASWKIRRVYATFFRAWFRSDSIVIGGFPRSRQVLATGGMSSSSCPLSSCHSYFICSSRPPLLVPHPSSTTRPTAFYLPIRNSYFICVLLLPHPLHLLQIFLVLHIILICLIFSSSSSCSTPFFIYLSFSSFFTLFLFYLFFLSSSLSNSYLICSSHTTLLVVLRSSSTYAFSLLLLLNVSNYDHHDF